MKDLKLNTEDLVQEELVATTSSKFYNVDPRNIVIIEDGNESNIRIDSDYGDIEGLMYDMIDNGQQQPLLVKKLKGVEKYQLIDGFRRYKAIKLAEEKGIPFRTVQVLSSQDSTEKIILKMLSTGIHSKSLSDFSIAIAVERLMNIGWSLNDIADKLKKKPQDISTILLLNQAPLKVKNYIKDGVIAKTVVLELLNEDLSSEEIIKLIDDAIAKKQEENEQLVNDDTSENVQPKKIKVRSTDLRPTPKVVMKQFIKEFNNEETDKSIYDEEKIKLVQFLLENKKFSYEDLLEMVKK